MLLRVVDRVAPIGAANSTYSMLREQELEQAAREARAYLMPLQGMFREKGIDAHSAVAYGRPVEAILETATGDDVDLIVIASHGQGGLARVFHSGIAAGLLQRTNRALLLIPVGED
jgi:nucleotide-binding universal stress UspA family protein